MKRYEVAVQHDARPIHPVRWCVRTRFGVVRSNLTLEEAESLADERDSAAARLAPHVDPEGICTCQQQFWRCASDEFAAHFRRAGA